MLHEEIQAVITVIIPVAFINHTQDQFVRCSLCFVKWFEPGKFR